MPHDRLMWWFMPSTYTHVTNCLVQLIFLSVKIFVVIVVVSKLKLTKWISIITATAVAQKSGMKCNESNWLFSNHTLLRRNSIKMWKNPLVSKWNYFSFEIIMKYHEWAWNQMQHIFVLLSFCKFSCEIYREIFYYFLCLSLDNVPSKGIPKERLRSIIESRKTNWVVFIWNLKRFVLIEMS